MRGEYARDAIRGPRRPATQRPGRGTTPSLRALLVLSECRARAEATAAVGEMVIMYVLNSCGLGPASEDWTSLRAESSSTCFCFFFLALAGGTRHSQFV